MDEDLRPRRLLTSPLGLLAAALLVGSVALNTTLGGDERWFRDGADLVTRGDLDEYGLRFSDGTMPVFTAVFVAIYPAAMAFSGWFLALAGWPVRVWSRAVMAVVLLALAALVVVQAQDRAPGREYSQNEAYLIIGTGLVTAVILAGVASMMFKRSRFVRCLVGASVPLLHAVGLCIGLVQVKDAALALSLGPGSVAFVCSLLLASASLLVLAAGVRQHDRDHAAWEELSALEAS